MQELNIDEYLKKEEGVKVVIKGKEYIVKDIPKDLPEDGDNVETLSRITGCPKEDLDGYGIVALLKLTDFIYSNLVPKTFQQPLLKG